MEALLEANAVKCLPHIREPAPAPGLAADTVVAWATGVQDRCVPSLRSSACAGRGGRGGGVMQPRPIPPLPPPPPTCPLPPPHTRARSLASAASRGGKIAGTVVDDLQAVARLLSSGAWPSSIGHFKPAVLHPVAPYNIGMVGLHTASHALAAAVKRAAAAAPHLEAALRGADAAASSHDAGQPARPLLPWLREYSESVQGANLRLGEAQLLAKLLAGSLVSLCGPAAPLPPVLTAPYKE